MPGAGPGPGIDEVRLVAAEVGGFVAKIAELAENKGTDEVVEVAKLTEEVGGSVETSDVGVGDIEEVRRVEVIVGEVDVLRVELDKVREKVEAVELVGNSIILKLTGIGTGGC